MIILTECMMGGYDEVPYPKDFLKRNPNFSENEYDGELPCWSLTSLLKILSKCAEHISEAGIAELSYEKVTKYCVSMLNCGKIKDCYADNPIDATYEMILKLHELNLL